MTKNMRGRELFLGTGFLVCSLAVMFGGPRTASAQVFVAAESTFRRGDVDSSGNLDLVDVMIILHHLFQGGGLDCPDAADVDNDPNAGGPSVTASGPIWIPSVSSS